MKNKIATLLLCSCVFIAPAVSAGIAGAAADSGDINIDMKKEMTEVGEAMQQTDESMFIATTIIHRPDGSVVSTVGAVKNPDGTVKFSDGSVLNADGSVKFADGSYRDKNGVYYNADGSRNQAAEQHQTVGEYLDDAGVTASVKAKFIGQSGLDSMDIHVETMNGVVTLSGQVDNQAQKSLAEEVAHEVDGVSKVENKIAVKK